MFTSLLWIAALVLVFFLVLPFLTVAASVLRSERKPEFKPDGEVDFGCIITAYRNADIARPLVQSLLKQPYKRFHVYLVADNCDVSGWDLEDERFTLINPQSALNLKVKSIIAAVEQYVRPHDYTVVFDADNLAHPDFLPEMNRYAQAGHRAIQGQRTAKNLNTTFAAADAIGEFYKNYIERYATYLLGSSAVISGSGMAVETELYKSYLYGKDITKGKELWKKMMQEDKILQNHLLRANEKIAFAWDAIVYDEKVTSGSEVQTQRSRWLFSYFQNMPNSLGFVLRGLFTFHWNKLLFGLVTIAPPMFILVGAAGLMMLFALMFDWRISAMIFVALGIFSLNVLLTLYLSRVPAAVWNGLKAIPGFIGRQATALVKMGNPNKNFKHSEHKHAVSVEEVLGKR